MKKFILPLISLILIIIIMIITIFSITSYPKKITSNTEIEVIKQDSNLDILINLGNFSKNNYQENKLLDISMQCAAKLNLMNETNVDDAYLQYVQKDDLHKLIFELTGLNIEAPIEIEDFYYLYDSENEYYYYIGASPNYYTVSNINSIKRKGNTYFIDCSIQKIDDGEKSIINNVSVTLTRNSENSFATYQVESIMFN